MSIKITTTLKPGRKRVTADGLELSARHRGMLQRAEQLKLFNGKGVMKRRKEAAALIRQVEAEREYQRETRDVQTGQAETLKIAEARAAAAVEQEIEADVRREVADVERVLGRRLSGAEIDAKIAEAKKERASEIKAARNGAVVEEVHVRGAFARGGEHGELQTEDGRPVLLTEPVVHKRIRDHDGLRTLFDDGKLGQREMLTGEAIRYLVEHAPARLGSCLEERTSSGSAARSDPYVAAALQRAYVGVVLTAVERAFGKREDGVAELHVLRAVAGEGVSLRSLGRGPNVQAANLRRLRRALAVADEAISAIRSTGGLRIRC